MFRLYTKFKFPLNQIKNPLQFYYKPKKLITFIDNYSHIKLEPTIEEYIRTSPSSNSLNKLNNYLSEFADKSKTNIAKLESLTANFYMLILYFMRVKQRIYPNSLYEISYRLLDELNGDNFPFFYALVYMRMLSEGKKLKKENLPRNFLSNIENHFFKNSIHISIKDLANLTEIYILYSVNEISQQFQIFLEKTILHRLENDEGILRSRASANLVTSFLNNNFTKVSSINFIEQYLKFISKCLNENLIDINEIPVIFIKINHIIDKNTHRREIGNILKNFMIRIKDWLSVILNNDCSDHILKEFFLLSKSHSIRIGYDEKNQSAFPTLILEKIVEKEHFESNYLFHVAKYLSLLNKHISNYRLIKMFDEKIYINILNVSTHKNLNNLIVYANTCKNKKLFDFLIMKLLEFIFKGEFSVQLFVCIKSALKGSEEDIGLFAIATFEHVLDLVYQGGEKKDLKSLKLKKQDEDSDEEEVTL